MSRLQRNFAVWCCTQLKHHSQQQLQGALENLFPIFLQRQLLKQFSPIRHEVILFLNQIIMINPFISNNDSNYLFRKNYQIIAKPQVTSPPTAFSTAKLNHLQSKNPFSSTIPTINPYTSPRSLSSSRANVMSSSKDKPLLGKSRLLEEADGWKRQLQSQERGKLQAYGVQGLRYNAYSTHTSNSFESRPFSTDRNVSNYQPYSSRDQHKFNDYYESYTKPLEVKSLKTAKSSLLYSSKNQSSPFQQVSKKGREHFSDEINQQEEPQASQMIQKQRNRYELQVLHVHQQSRHSKLADMFGDMDDRFKQSMKHNSYASYYGEDLVESKPSRFAKDSFQQRGNHFFQESKVDKFNSKDPPSLTIHGKIYYKVEI